jgi:hypothetical protein
VHHELEPILIAEKKLRHQAVALHTLSEGAAFPTAQGDLQSFLSKVEWSPLEVEIVREGEGWPEQLHKHVGVFVTADGASLLLLTEVRFDLDKAAHVRFAGGNLVASRICAVAIDRTGMVQGSGSDRVYELVQLAGTRRRS